MHERRRPQRRLARQAEVGEGGAALAELDAVRRRELHEEVVRMLAIDQRRRAVGRLAGLSEQRIAALAHRRIERDHSAQAERSGTERAIRHQHRHALGEDFLAAPRPGLAVVDGVDEALRHQLPVAAREVQAIHRCRIGLPTTFPSRCASSDTARTRCASTTRPWQAAWVRPSKPGRDDGRESTCRERRAARCRRKPMQRRRADSRRSRSRRRQRVATRTRTPEQRRRQRGRRAARRCRDSQ